VRLRAISSRLIFPESVTMRSPSGEVTLKLFAFPSASRTSIVRASNPHLPLEVCANANIGDINPTTNAVSSIMSRLTVRADFQRDGTLLKFTVTASALRRSSRYLALEATLDRCFRFGRQLLAGYYTCCAALETAFVVSVERELKVDRHQAGPTARAISAYTLLAGRVGSHSFARRARPRWLVD
jgi:hypothetical protein